MTDLNETQFAANDGRNNIIIFYLLTRYRCASLFVNMEDFVSVGLECFNVTFTTHTRNIFSKLGIHTTWKAFILHPQWLVPIILLLCILISSLNYCIYLITLLIKRRSSLSVTSFDIKTVIPLFVVLPVMCEFEFNKWLFEDTALLSLALCKKLIKECINEVLSDFPKGTWRNGT